MISSGREDEWDTEGAFRRSLGHLSPIKLVVGGTDFFFRGLSLKDVVKDPESLEIKRGGFFIRHDFS